MKFAVVWNSDTPYGVTTNASQQTIFRVCSIAVRQSVRSAKSESEEFTAYWNQNSPTIMTKQIFQTKSELVTATVKVITETIRTAELDNRTCAIALSGGSTPKDVYAALAQKPEINWSAVRLYWGDERMVPPDHADSNYRMTKEALLDHIAIPEENIFRIKGELPPEKAAEDYERKLAQSFNSNPPVFDLILLGLGEDGHTASLFPDTEILNERRRTAAAVFVPKLDTWRVSLTFPVLNQAKEVLFLVAGESKADMVKQILEDPKSDFSRPASMVSPVDGKLTWFLDSLAARMLTS